MQYTVAFATYELFPMLFSDDQALLEPLAQLGIQAQPVVWNKPNVDWTTYDAVVIRSTWDYYEHIEAFRAWLTHLETLNIRVLNPIAVVRENLDKRYLKTLSALGIATVPTVWVEADQVKEMALTITSLPWADVVVKPAVSAGAYRTHHLSREDLARRPELLAQVVGSHGALIQPFMEEIPRDGEWSFLYFGDEFSHAVVKTAKAGDFRVQWRHGGTHRQVTPAAALRQQVEAVFAKLAGQRLYTRIDGIVRDGQFLVVEIEMIEPYLFLAEEETAPARFARALKAQLKTNTLI